MASLGTENLVTEQAGILQARQLPLGSLFPLCKTDTPTADTPCGRERQPAGVFETDKHRVSVAQGPKGFLFGRYFVLVGFSHPCPTGLCFV